MFFDINFSGQDGQTRNLTLWDLIVKRFCNPIVDLRRFFVIIFISISIKKEYKVTIGTIETVGFIGLALIVIGGAISIGGARYAAGITPPEVMFWKIYNDPEQAEIELNAMSKKSKRGMKIAWVGMIICIIGALVVLSMGPLSMLIPR